MKKLIPILMMAVTLTLTVQMNSASAGSFPATPDYSDEWLPYLELNDKGTLNVVVEGRQADNDGTTDDWYVYEVRSQAVPGKVTWGSDWVLDDLWMEADVVGYGSVRNVTNNSPAASVNESTVEVSVVASANPQISATWSYTGSDVTIADDSIWNLGNIDYRHDIGKPSFSSEHTYVAKPGFVIKADNNAGSFVNAKFKVKFADKKIIGWDTHTLGWGSTLFLDICDCYE